MIPSLVVSDIRQSIVEFLASTFALTDDHVRSELTSFLEHPTDGIFRGPYLRVRTPFRAVDADWRNPLGWLPEWFVPYQHQATAFERLSTVGDRRAEPTLVTTGTGSGKTECFLMPVLDHCRRHLGEPGIKAIVLYPMNALASDQAGRLAELIDTEPELAGIRAGIYVGESGSNTSMRPDRLIDHRPTLRSDPPDILLTNYKMLDFLLLREADAELWNANTASTLRYLVLDEFHTYDGAQGTDVAMLLRRLGRRLNMATPDAPLGSAAPVATSATLGTGAQAVDELCEFAGKVFGTQFERDAVIGETRQTVDEACSAINYELSTPEVADVVDAGDDLDAIAAAFCRRETLDSDTAGDDELDPRDVVTLGERLLEHPLTRAVLAAVGNTSRSWPDALAEINTRTPNWGRSSMRNPAAVEAALSRYLWLLSLARRTQGERRRPLFAVDVQLWVREVSRLLRTVSATPHFRWVDTASDDDPSSDDPTVSLPELPAIYCRRCGQAGWRATRSEIGTALNTKIGPIYAESVKRSATIRDLILTRPEDPAAVWYRPLSRQWSNEAPAGDDDPAVPVLLSDDEDDAKAQRCPSCGERDSIRFIGLQVASLASVAVNTLFGSPHVEHDERKLLAFTDSVQDASHRAAFFSGRTHRFNLRSRMADIVADLESVSLADLGTELLNRATSPNDRYDVVPPDLLADGQVKTVWTDAPTDLGLDRLRGRLAFEADLELGLRSRVGRTLELSRAVAASVDLDNADVVYDLVVEDLRRLDGNVAADTLAAVPAYVRGLLERLRIRGGIWNPLLQPYLDDNGRQWHIWGGRPAGLPPFTPGQGRPTFYTTANRSDFDSVTASGSTPTWLVDWAARSLGIDRTMAPEANRNALHLISGSSTTLRRHGTKAGNVYALERSAITVVDLPDEPRTLRCDLCGNRQPAPEHLVDTWYGSPCLRYRCIGSYVEFETTDGSYYRSLYRSGGTRRVITGEHTGLLRREQREQLETAFKTGTAPDSPNLIAATPTLEMGIDIGDLSAVMLTSVPPTPANYAQRVGRAGRLTGNSLITTFVRTNTHGLYYLSDPEAMIAGDVRSPNCYLDAAETLRRQYVAYVLDRIADSTIDAEPLPDQIRGLMKAPFDDDGVFRRVIDVSMQSPDLVDEFVSLFGIHLAPATADVLREYALAGIEADLKGAVERWRESEQELVNRIRRLRDAIDRLEQEAAPDEERLGSLKGQRQALVRLLHDHRNEYTLSALERLGVLPNYLLLGDTTTLRATLWSRDEATSEYRTDAVEYQRPAALALTEFAPGNSFYAGGHRHMIDALEIGSFEQPLYETWRLCPECGHGDIEPDGAPPARCPRCGLTGIADNGARHTMLRLRSVTSSSSEESARVHDETDERQRERYETALLVDVDDAFVTGSWKLADVAFGAEMAEITKLRTINCGLMARKGSPVRIAGADRHVTRFTVCRHCGAVSDVRDDRDGTHPERLHQGWCKVRSGAVGQQWDPIMLLHELETEAVRLLLPVSLFEIDERLASFKAALLLGLRADFGGDPDHLEVTRMQLPNTSGQGQRHYLVLYDRVPGGTGYLARLCEPDRMKTILEHGRRIISSCVCRTEGRRACHRCLLGVLGQHEYELVSRDLALELLDSLLDDAQWEPTATGPLSQVEIGNVEESELERLFKVALRTWAEHPQNPSVTFRQAAGRGRFDAFELLFERDGTTTRYRIEEQLGLGTTPSTTPDFVITREDARGTPIAVYLDGYQYHASPEINHLAADAAKRRGIRIAGHLVWSMTWDDVKAFFDAASREDLRPPAATRLLEAGARRIAEHRRLDQAGRFDIDVLDRDPMLLLVSLLADPDRDQWESLALSAVTGAFSDAHDRGGSAASNIETAMRTAIRSGTLTPAGDDIVAATWSTANGLSLHLFLPRTDSDKERWTVVAAIADADHDVRSSGHQQRWRDWLRWSNVLQLLQSDHRREAVICARSEADDIDLDQLWIVTPPTETATATAPETPVESVQLSTEMIEELDFVDDDSTRDLVRNALQAGAPDFVAGYELDGQPIEAAWETQRVGVLVSDDRTADNWTLRPAADWTLDELLDALKEGD